MILRVENLHKVYNNGKIALHVLKGINLNIEEGLIFAIVGPSGAGKSTLLNLLGGLDEPTQGKVFLKGEDLYALSDLQLSRIRNRTFGFVFQFYHLLPEFTVLENVLLPAMVNSFNNLRQLRIRAEGLLERAGLKEKIYSFPAQLSGGEQQRVAICRSLINEPQILYCDEPTGNLDSFSGREIISLIKELNLKNKMTVVLVTHNEELSRIADKVFYLKDGVLKEGERI
ncbi:MAG: ABC transporter ATP-binding protein [Candidatus Omnitrophica bacterium]|nr:ABC transporter ATP-binding protein [Candidatus Omnitrophota bacterium]